MNVLSDSMTRLCAQITALRRARQDLCATLKEASQTRSTIMKEMCAGLTAARQQSGQKNAKHRQVFMNRLRRQVEQQRDDIRNDLAKAKAAWLGSAA